MPTLIYPAFIFVAIDAHASNPLEHNLLMAATVVDSGNPDTNWATLEVIAPAPN